MAWSKSIPDTSIGAAFFNQLMVNFAPPQLPQIHVVESAVAGVLEQSVFHHARHFGRAGQCAFVFGNLPGNRHPLHTFGLLQI